MRNDGQVDWWLFIPSRHRTGFYQVNSSYTHHGNCGRIGDRACSHARLRPLRILSLLPGMQCADKDLPIVGVCSHGLCSARLGDGLSCCSHVLSSEATHFSLQSYRNRCAAVAACVAAVAISNKIGKESSSHGLAMPSFRFAVRAYSFKFSWSFPQSPLLMFLACKN